MKKKWKQWIPTFIVSYKYNPTYQFIRRGYTTTWTEQKFKEYAENNGIQAFEGIYQVNNQRYFIKKHDSYYYIVACGRTSKYLEGDIKAQLTPTSTSNVFLGTLNSGDQDNGFRTATFVFNQIGLEYQSGNVQQLLIKVWPSVEENIADGKKWTGTGWALNNGYIVTNHHVADGAKSISVKTFHNGISNEYTASIIALDKDNDLAILYVEELKNDIVPYSIRNGLCNVGEKCYVLGYPMSSVLGNEVKLTDGVISSRTGYAGSMVLYQISAAVQPGNSGGPMFDENGNIAGIVNSGVPSADNVGYAIKLSYLRTLLENFDLVDKLPNGTIVNEQKTIADKVAVMKKYVYLLECADR